MGCEYQRKMKNPRYEENKKNKGIIPEIRDERTGIIPIKCGRCRGCRKAKANNIRIRLMEEHRTNPKKGYSITLSFSDERLVELEKQVRKKISKMIIENRSGIKENTKKQMFKLQGYAMDNEMVIIAIKEFREKIRLYNKNHKTGEKTEMWLITELGQKNTERIHLHGIIWTNQLKRITEYWEKINGNIKLGDGNKEWVNDQTVNYLVKYITKVDKKHKYYKAKIFSSNGIGKGYLNREDAKINRYDPIKTNTTYTDRQGNKRALPAYYKNNIIKDDEKRENVWIQSMDKNIRYVDGAKIDMTQENAEENYNRAIEEARKKSTRMGYPNNKINQNEINYEKAKRHTLRMKRIQKVYATNNKKAS